MDLVIPILEWAVEQLQHLPGVLAAILRLVHNSLGPYAPTSIGTGAFGFIVQSWQFLLAALLLFAVVFGSVVMHRWKLREPMAFAALQFGAGWLAVLLLLPWQADMLAVNTYASLEPARLGGLIVAGLTGLRGLDNLRRARTPYHI